jgi:Holin of 3TMs, for gene-transfer release
VTDKAYNKMSESEKKKEDWMNSKWRPMMGWTYMITCIFDFVAAPILWSLTQSLFHGSVQTQWQPLTLQGAGLYHIAMGAVLGIAAYGRTQEKLGGANNGGINLPSNVGTTYTPPPPTGQSMPGAFGAPTATTVTQSWGSAQPGSGFGAVPPATGFGGNTGFGAGTSGFNSQSATAAVSTGWGGKKVVPQQDDPLI